MRWDAGSETTYVNSSTPGTRSPPAALLTAEVVTRRNQATAATRKPRWRKGFGSWGIVPSFAALDRSVPLQEKLGCIHAAVRARFDFIDRVAVAIYDPESDLLKTFIDSSGANRPLARDKEEKAG